MIVFALYLHVCSMQLTSMHGGVAARSVTACGPANSGQMFATKIACDAAGKAKVAEPDVGTDIAEERRKVDAYECRPLQVGQ